ncbi:lantibiotic dehydratase [Streptomyces sp. NPDC052721]|uniref:lantibiotic dehydratase n=1 Tax=Streptomyces sp. NPDC052721 TaxID=3154955 RepID=UPI0034333C62
MTAAPAGHLPRRGDGRAPAPDLVRLADTRWWLHREFALRGAGFPLTGIARLRAPELAGPAGSDLPPEAFAAHYATAVRRLTGELRDLAADPRLREAIAWQNPAVVRNCLDKLAADRALPGSERRRSEVTLAKYLQRYTVKNDTIGFFGPVCWATVEPGGPALTVRPGASLPARRTVYFETWAIDEVAAAMSRDPEAYPWLRPRLSDGWSHDGTAVRGPHGRTVGLDPDEADVLRACDGTRTVRDLTAGPDPARVLTVLRSLAERGLITLSLTGPVEARPERTLRAKLLGIADERVRDRLLADLDTLIAARDRVAAAAGDPERLTAALGALDTTFERLTGTGAVRRAGAMYAGRTLVYEDTVRDLGCELGAGVLDEVAASLAPVLHTAQWLAGRAAQLYSARLLELHRKVSLRHGTDEVPLALLVGAATPDLVYTPRTPPPLVRRLTEEFRARWARVLRLPGHGARCSIAPRVLAERVAREFPLLPARWSAARHHAPDVMIAASDPEAVERGEFLLVLGEMHVAMNTLEARFFVEQHPDPGRLLARAAADHQGRRVVAVPARASAGVTSRTYPPALLSPEYHYWTMYADSTGAPGPITPAADLVVRADGGRLVVHDRGTGAVHDLLEVLGEYLSGVVVGAFGIAAAQPHRPRVCAGRLVLAREAWSFPLTGVDWPRIKDEAARYRAAWRWRRDQQLPERVFYQVPGEDKPLFLDFASPALVNLAAGALRRGAADHPEASVTVSEMLPDAEQCWLRDASGAAYTSELRLVFTDPEHDRGAPGDGDRPGGGAR